MLENVWGYDLGLVTAGERAHNMTCKNYDESITTIRLQSSHDHNSQQHACKNRLARRRTIKEQQGF